MLGDSFIELVIDLSGVIIETEQFNFFHHTILVFGASHDWSIVTSDVCCIDPLLLLLITLPGQKILLFFICFRAPEAA